MVCSTAQGCTNDQLLLHGLRGAGHGAAALQHCFVLSKLRLLLLICCWLYVESPCLFVLWAHIARIVPCRHP